MQTRMLRRGWLWLGVLLYASGARADDSHLRYLPSDTKLVLTIYPPSLAAEEQKNGLKLLRRLYFDRLTPELAKSEKLPISDVSQVVIGWAHAGTLRCVLVVRGKIDRALLEKQCRAAAKTSKNLTIETMGTPSAVVVRRKLDEGLWTELFPQLGSVPGPLRKLVAPEDVYVAALDDETLFVSLAGKTQVQRALRAKPASTKLRIDDELIKLLKKQDPRDVAAFAMLDDSLTPALHLVATAAAKETFDQFAHITARVRGGKEIEITVRATGKSNELGRVLLAKSEKGLEWLRGSLDKLVPAQTQREIVEGMLKAVRVSRKDDVVTLTARLSQADARKLLPVVSEKKER